jgi:uncharacterized protein YndB with AHSA1/START domain
MLKTILFLLLAIIILALIYAFFSEKKYSIQSETVINKPASEVFNYVKNLKNQEKYSKWVMTDPNVKLTYTGTDGTVGFKAAWESDDKNVGVGEQEIMKIIDGKGYEAEIRFKKPMEGTSLAKTMVDSMGVNQSKVTTTFYTETPFPINLMIPIIKNMLQKDMDQNMVNLKGQLEK